MKRPTKTESSADRPATGLSRRDFLNGALIGSGAMLLSAVPPLASARSALAAGAAVADSARHAPSGSPWTGYGGVGDYRWSNGNTQAVMDAAHGIRDRLYGVDGRLAVEEEYDLVVVGGGFSGVTSAYEFNKHRRPDQRCLLLDNHPVFGGEAKQNEFMVDGRRLIAPQGSNGGLVPGTEPVTGRYAVYADYYRELELPSDYELEPLAGGAEKYTLANDHFDPMVQERNFDTGYFFPGHGWVRNPGSNGFSRTPWSARAQRDMDDFFHNRRDLVTGREDVDRWLDSMSYYDLLDKLGYGDEVKRYADPVFGAGNYGVCGNAISAYAAKRLTQPGTIPSTEASRYSTVKVVSMPGGNAGILRRMLARMLPDAIPGDGSVATAVMRPVDFDALDRPGNGVRVRLSSTVVDVRHEGDPASAGSVLVTYVRDGKLHRVRAKAVVMATGGWVNKHVVGDLPQSHAAAYAQFRYGPVLTANVAVRHWRFIDKLGISTARWFEGFGWHVTVRRNVTFEARPRPLTPDDPVVLTFYTPFLYPELDPAVQGIMARNHLLSTSYADFERQILEQMSAMFGGSGFDARRDVAGIVLNRWGHAFVSPGPGFFFGSGSAEAPHETIRRPHGRIVFAHSELQGNMNMAHAMLEAHRGIGQVRELL